MKSIISKFMLLLFVLCSYASASGLKAPVIVGPSPTGEKIEDRSDSHQRGQRDFFDALERMAATNPALEKLEGIAAQRHLENLRSRHPGTFERAAAVLRQQGFRETERVRVWRTSSSIFSLPSPEGSTGVKALTDYVFTGNEGEVVAWDWDDGDYSTWEGSVYLFHYGSGAWITVDAQLLVTAGNEMTSVWDQPIAGGGALDPEINPLSINPERSASVDMPGIRRKWFQWLACSAIICGGMYITCHTLNPTPQEAPDVVICTMGGCLAGGVGCLTFLMP